MERKAFAAAMIVMATVALAVIIADARAAEHVYGVKIVKNCGHRAHPDACRWRRHRLHVIKPYIRSFLQPTGACESGTDYNLRHGLHAYSSAGPYLGRYQFGQADWNRAGGSGDPRWNSWLEQAFRAVRWLQINGRDSWPNC